MSKKLGYRNFWQTIYKIVMIILRAPKTFHEFCWCFGISLIILVVNYILRLNIMFDENDLTSLYITFIGLGVTIFAVFMTEIERFDEFFDSFENDNNFHEEFLALSIYSVLIPFIGLMPTAISIEQFNVCQVYIKYWNSLFVLLSLIWLIHTIFHLLSLKIK